ncbi:MAG: gamma-glutamyl-gamma-aminobutyrate hydrolase family protein [Lachnospiraceae bacterium]|nr:gamma-glutamyl-gamma-aminobutyrate hydrolase family protein [Lachnospiraceae bacterium]
MRILIAERTIDHVQNYANALNRIGMNFDISLKAEDLSTYDALLLPGGADIYPSRYNEEIDGSVGIDEELDEGQFQLMDLFVKAKKPVFGICRGCQLINVYFGGSMIQHIPVADEHKAIAKGVDNQHFVKSVAGSEIEALYGTFFKVNSSHHQGCKEIGKGLKVTLWSEDGIVEALEHESLPVAGVQWHPERTCLFAEEDGIVDGELVIRHFLQK